MPKGSSQQPVFRAVLLLLALVNLAMLGSRLWPWPAVMSLPGNGATGIDPAVSLVGYVAVAFWIGSARSEAARKQLYRSGWLGLLAGVFLAAEVYLATRPIEVALPTRIHLALFALAAVVWGYCAVRAVRGAHSLGFAIVCGIWSAMVSSLLACMAVLGASFYAMTPGQTSDPWKQYQGLAIGTEDTQALVHTLVTATGFLLIGPIVGALVGGICAAMLKPAPIKA